MDSREIRELLSACRPDRSDLTAEQLRAVDEHLGQDAELREQWAASQAWDAQVRAAFADVPIPTGLADRLLAAVSEPAAESVVTVPRTTLWSRRTILSVGAAAAAVALVAVSLAYWHRSDRLTTDLVVQKSQLWAEQIDPAGWRDDAIPTADYPLDTMLAIYNVAWQRLSLTYDSEAVVYQGELAPDRSTASLFAVRTHLGQELRSDPPPRPDSSTGGRCIGVWKSKGILYVLIVNGSPSQYRRAIRQAYA